MFKSADTMGHISIIFVNLGYEGTKDNRCFMSTPVTDRANRF